MNKLHIFILALILTINNSFSQQKTYLSDAVNAAGKQRMLGQRMAKNKVFLEADEHTDYAKKELEGAIAAFNTGLSKLKDFAPTDILKYKIAVQEYAFKSYKKTIIENSKKSMKEVIKTNTLFLAICNDVVTELIKYAKVKSAQNPDKNKKYVLTKIAEATGASGKLRYLTQRLSLYFAMNEYEIQRVSPGEIHKIIQTMDKNLNYLTVLEFNTMEIDDALSDVQYHWSSLKRALYKNGQIDLSTNKINALQLYKLCNTILGKANTATKMYADLNKS